MMPRRSLLLALVVLSGCGSKAETPTGTGSGSAIARGSAADAGGGAAAVVRDAGADASAGLVLEPGERAHDPRAEMTWTPPAGSMTVTLVDREDDTSHVVVWGRGARHDVVTIDHHCMGGEHGAELWTGAKNTVVFRCESQKEDRVVADEWLIRWTDNQDAPAVDRHWQGGREQRDPKWAGARRLYDAQKPEHPPSQCCCSWQDEGEPGFEMTTRDYCKGSEDHHGICVADAKCAKPDEP